MARPVPVDVLDRSVDSVDDLDREDVVQVLRRPVLVIGRLDLDDRAGLLAAFEMAALGFQLGTDAGQELGGDRGIDQQRLGGVANRDVLTLRIDGDVDRHVQVRLAIDVDVADPVGVTQDGDIRIVHDIAHELVGAAWDDQVEVLVEREHLRDVLTGFEQLDPAGGHAGRLAGFGDDLGQDAIGLGRLAAPFE